LRAAKAGAIQIRAGRGVALENPQPWSQLPSLFYLEPLTELLALGARDVDSAQCPFGAASTKRTRIRYYRGTFEKLELQKCRHPDREWWDADTGHRYWKPHEKLAGVRSSPGVWATKGSEAYPDLLNTALAKYIASAWQEIIADKAAA
jgi:hypothetical protein